MPTRNIVKPKFKTRSVVGKNDIPVATGLGLEEYISPLKEIEIPGIGSVVFFTNYINTCNNKLDNLVLEPM